MKKPIKLLHFLGRWAEENIFEFKKHDAFFYLVLYAIIPIIVTLLSLKHASGTSIKLVYCYTTILINCAGSLYDAVNRWKSKTQSFLNFKLIFIFIPDIIICAYCVVEIMSYIIGQTFYVWDYILCVYFVAVAVSVIDCFLCCTREIAIGNIVESQNNQTNDATDISNHESDLESK